MIPLLVLSQEESPYKYGVDTTAVMPAGIMIGDKAPMFKGTSLQGEEVDAEKLLEKGPLVIIFYRGEWCGICKRHLSNLNDSLSFIVEKGATVIAMGIEKQRYAEVTLAATKAQFHVMTDSTLEIPKAYDVLFTLTKKYQGWIAEDIDVSKEETVMMPVPATFVISKEGIITYRHFNYNYRKRATVYEILENL